MTNLEFLKQEFPELATEFDKVSKEVKLDVFGGTDYALESEYSGTDRRSLIDKAFSWNDTPQWYDFWKNVYDKADPQPATPLAAEPETLP